MANQTEGLTPNGISKSLHNIEEALSRNGVHYPVFNWQMMTVIVSILLAGAFGIIQLGTAQTHITVNTDIIKQQVEDIRTLREIAAELKASESEQNRRLSTIETHDVETRKTEATINSEIAKLQASQPEQDRRIAAIEQLLKEAAAKADVIQTTNTLRIEFLSEIKRLDGLLKDIKDQLLPKTR